VPWDIRSRLEPWRLGTQKNLCIEGKDRDKWLEPFASHIFSQLKQLGKLVVMLYLRNGSPNAEALYLNNINLYSSETTQPLALQSVAKLLYDQHALRQPDQKSRKPIHVVLLIRKSWNWPKEPFKGDEEEDFACLEHLCLSKSFRFLWIIDGFVSAFRKWIPENIRAPIRSTPCTVKLANILLSGA
jgi:hypothetical protein